ncbi:MAG: hypothetical protein AAF236_06215 [Verrucomicrobiota bacterium]
MKITRLTDPPPSGFASALSEFEKEFIYPLGQDSSFSISHGADYSRFFRSIGEASIYIAEKEGRVLGTLVLIRRKIRLSDGGLVSAAYLCDAKVVANCRSGIVLGRLALTTLKDALNDGYQSAFSVVMRGSLPADRYTGRLGIPKFSELCSLAILRIETTAIFPELGESELLPDASYHRPTPGDLALSSQISPMLVSVAGASGTLTDTRKGKRLWQDNGSEMISAHLGGIEFSSFHSLTRLIREALQKAHDLGFPALFLALPSELVSNTFDHRSGITVAHASVYGSGLPSGSWMINTAEI